MKNNSEYDMRQLRLMYNNLIFFERKQVELSSLVGSLEFLLNALESVDDTFEEKFLNEITTLETVNALEIIKDSGEDFSEIEKQKRESLIIKSIKNLKNIIKNELNLDLSTVL